MDILKSKCLILNKKELNEADLLATVFSKDFGKILGMSLEYENQKKEVYLH